MLSRFTPGIAILAVRGAHIGQRDGAFGLDTDSRPVVVVEFSVGNGHCRRCGWSLCDFDHQAVFAYGIVHRHIADRYRAI